MSSQAHPRRSSSSPSIDLIDCEEIAFRLKQSSRTVHRCFRARLLPGIQIGRKWYMRASDLDSFLARGIRASKERCRKMKKVS